MSLIITTSKIDENSQNISSENPSNFTNFFRSPIEVPENSEIAVESIKINRTANVDIKDKNNYFCHFFGEEFDELSDRSYRINVPRTIQLKQKSYNLGDYVSELQSKLNSQYAHPSIFKRSTVTLDSSATGVEGGVKIQFAQRPVDAVNKTASLTDSAYYNIANPISGTPSDDYTWTPATGILARTGATSSVLANASCVAILKNRPFSNGSGSFTTTVVNASANYWVVGLSRPHVQYEVDDDGTRRTRNTYPNGWQDSYNFRFYDGQIRSRMNEHYDFGVVYRNGVQATDGVRIFCSLNRVTATLKKDLIRHYEIKYWESGGVHTGAPMTAAQFNASYDRVRFTSAGGYLSVYFGQKGKATYDQMCGPNLSKDTDKCLKPIGDTTYALYPQINIGSGNVEVTQFTSEYNDSTYLFPVYNASDAQVGTAGPRQFVPGSDFFSNNRIQKSNLVNIVNNQQITLYRDPDNRVIDDGAIYAVDKSRTYVNWHSVNSLSAYTTPSGFNASGGVLNDHVLIGNRYNRPNIEDYLLSSQRFPNMSPALGYIDRSIISQIRGNIEGYVSGDNTNTVIFTSPQEIEKSSTVSYVRIPNLTHKSFNGAQSGLSKILYQVPQFSNDGRQFGPLYFAPPEKTYIDLQNTGRTLLNSLQVQLVGVDEKEIDSLTGTTQVVFHIRAKKV
jgi:hypothetical protein